MAHRPTYIIDSVTVDRYGQKTATFHREVRQDHPAGLVPTGSFTVAAPDEETAALLVPGKRMHIDFVEA